MNKLLGIRALKSRLRVKHLELFRHVCQLHTLRRAADASAMTQPAATKLIRELEQMVGHDLFVRDRSGMHPNEHARVLLRHANVVLSDIEMLRGEFELLDQGISGRIRLGVIPSYSSELLADCIAAALSQSPQVQFEIREASTSVLLKDLAANELDLTFGRPLDSQELAKLEVLEVYAESFAVTCAIDHPLVSKRRVGWRELAAERWALPAANTPLRRLVDSRFLSESLVPPTGVIEVISFEKSQSIISRTDLVGLLPTTLAAAAKARKQLAVVGPALTDFGPISLLRRGGAEPSPVVSMFVEIVRRLGRKRLSSPSQIAQRRSADQKI